MPNGFDTQFHAFFDGVGAYGNTIGVVERVSPGAASAPDRVVDAIRRGIAARIDAALQQPSAGIARALITGDQSVVTDEARETMSVAGLAHVLSVSGLHLTIVAGLVSAGAPTNALAQQLQSKVDASNLTVIDGRVQTVVSGMVA